MQLLKFHSCDEERDVMYSGHLLLFIMQLLNLYSYDEERDAMYFGHLLLFIILLLNFYSFSHNILSDINVC